LLDKPLRTSDILTALGNAQEDRLSVHEILLALKTRAFALLVVVLGLPNCLPMPPPIPLICGFLLLFVSLQMMFGLQAPWIPNRIARQSVARADVSRAVARSLPVVRWLERISRQRLVLYEGALASRAVGLMLLVLSTGLLLAAPFVGQIPMGVAICLVGLGLVERDGLVVLCGVLIGLVGIALNVGFVVTLVHWIALLFR
jgi:hypothetical protein